MKTHDIDCPECGAKMMLKQGRFGLFYGCVNYPSCDGSHGAHEDGTPLGIPANKVTKQARIHAHSVFDQLWQDGPAGRKASMTRSEAYIWLQETLGLTKGEVHIGRFNVQQCDDLVAAVTAYGLAEVIDPNV